MIRLVFTCLVFFVCVSSLQAKVIFIGSHGGANVYFAGNDSHEVYNPLQLHREEGELISAEDASKENEGGHGVDAVAVYLKTQRPNETFFALISKETSDLTTAFSYVTHNYEEGDLVFLVGYSAGGKFVINLAYKLRNAGYPVHALGLIDAFVGLKTEIPENVSYLGVYYQETEDLKGFNSFTLANDAFTEYFAPGYPIKITDATHISIDNDERVWKDFGNKVLGIIPVSSTTCTTQTEWFDGDGDSFPEIEVNGWLADCDDSDPTIYPFNSNPCKDCNEDTTCGSGTDDPDDPTIYTQDQDSDLHIKDFYLAIYGSDHWEHRVEMQLYPGQSFQIEGKARIENDSGVDADDIDSDYRVDHGKNFDDQDTKLDEDNPFDLDPYEVVTKKMGRTTISLSQDGQSVKVQGPGRSESFDVEDGFCKIYFFVDVENDDDKDISSNTDSDEYGVVEVTVSGVSPDNSGYIPSPVSFSAQQAAALISIISN